jgi:GTP1/Obg family GTP-binding protein
MEINPMFELLSKIDNGFSNPVLVVRKKVEDLPVESEKKEYEEMEDQENQEEDEQPVKDEIVDGWKISRRTIKLFKFWPKDILKSAWINYLHTGE